MKVLVSITLSKEIDIDVNNNETIKQAVKKQICLPSDAGVILNNVTNYKGTPQRMINKAIKDLSDWVVDEFTVLEND